MDAGQRAWVAEQARLAELRRQAEERANQPTGLYRGTSPWANPQGQQGVQQGRLMPWERPWHPLVAGQTSQGQSSALTRQIPGWVDTTRSVAERLLEVLSLFLSLGLLLAQLLVPELVPLLVGWLPGLK